MQAIFIDHLPFKFLCIEHLVHLNILINEKSFLGVAYNEFQYTVYTFLVCMVLCVYKYKYKEEIEYSKK